MRAQADPQSRCSPAGRTSNRRPEPCSRACRGRRALALVRAEPTPPARAHRKRRHHPLASPSALRNRGLIGAPETSTCSSGWPRGAEPVGFNEGRPGLGRSLGVLDVPARARASDRRCCSPCCPAWRCPARARRLGPAEAEAEDTRSDAVDLVASPRAACTRAPSRAARPCGSTATRTPRPSHTTTGLSGHPLPERVHAGLFGVVPSRSACRGAVPGQFAAGLRALNQAFSGLRGRRGRGMRTARPAPPRPLPQETHR